MTTLVDNVLGYQLLDSGDVQLTRTNVMLDAVVAAGVDGAVELIGPGRAQFAVHAPPIEAEVDAARLATALAHLVADVAGIDATGNARVGVVPTSGVGGYVDSTIVVAAALRGESVRIEVRGPYTGGDPVHEPIVRGIVRAHGGVLQTHVVPGMSGSAYVLEVPIGGGAGAVPVADPSGVVGAAGPHTSVPGTAVEVASAAGPARAETGAEVGVGLPEQASGTRVGRRRARRASGASVDSFLESGVAGAAGAADAVPGADEAGQGGGSEAAAPTGRRRRRAEESAAAGAPGSAQGQLPAQATQTPAGGTPAGDAGAGTGTGRRRGRPNPAEVAVPAGADAGPGATEGSVMTAAEHAAGSPALGETVPPQGVPVGASSGRRARRNPEQAALPAGGSGASGASGASDASQAYQNVPAGRRARRALGSAPEREAEQAGRRAHRIRAAARGGRPDDARAGHRHGRRRRYDYGYGC